MKQTLIAQKPVFYRHRMLSAGQTFEASPIDAQYLISRGQAAALPRASADEVAPVADVPRETLNTTGLILPVAPIAATTAVEVVSEPVVVEAPVVEVVAERAPEEPTASVVEAEVVAEPVIEAVAEPVAEADAEPAAVVNESLTTDTQAADPVVPRRPYTRRSSRST